MNIEEIRGKTDAELEYERNQLQQKIFDLRFRAATETSANPARIREMRRAVARIHTVLHERSAKIRGQESR
jgi:large subunit ribosomal protein L29